MTGVNWQSGARPDLAEGGVMANCLELGILEGTGGPQPVYQRRSVQQLPYDVPACPSTRTPSAITEGMARRCMHREFSLDNGTGQNCLVLSQWQPCSSSRSVGMNEKEPSTTTGTARRTDP